jgi:hypothetical protein
MSKLSFSSLNNNNFFTPAFLIFGLIASNIVFSQELFSSFSLYFFVFAIVILVQFLKGFVFNFATLDNIINTSRKSIYIVINTILQLGQYYALYFGLVSLNKFSTASDLINYIGYALILYILQMFLNKNFRLNPVYYIEIGVLLIAKGLLLFKLFGLTDQIQVTENFYNYLAISILAMEAYQFLLATRQFLKKG